MPTYTYQCENCGVRFERQQKFSEQPLSRCPECSKRTLRKIITPVGIVFKGSGFYATDHRSPSGVSHKNGSKKDESETKSKEETKNTEKKEATKKESNST